MDVALIVESLRGIAAGIPLTLGLAAASLSAGLLLACAIAGARLAKIRALSAAAYAYVSLIRGTPLIVQVFFIYYGLSQLEEIRSSFLWPAFRNEVFCGALALALNTGAYTSEIIRGGLRSVPAGQIEAAIACGMSRFSRLRHITVPLAIRQMLPAYGNEVILMIKATSIASVITVMEITGIARTIAGQTFAPIEVFSAAGLLYLTINGALTAVIRALERRLGSRGGMS
jgi:octopine/nopaline transport system permease protein